MPRDPNCAICRTLPYGACNQHLADTVGECVNHRCSRFEYPVYGASEGDRCADCEQFLCHESGLTWADARALGYQTAGAAAA